MVFKPTLKDSAPAGEDLSNALNLLAKRDADGNFVLCAAGDMPAGSIYEANSQGRPITVDAKGIVQVKMGGACSPGDEITAGADGVAVAAETAGSGFAYAREAGVADQIVSVTVK